MTSTDLEPLPPGVVSLFPGATTADVIDFATDVSTRFSKIVKDRRMYTRIGESDHIRIEAWQTIGALTNVFAVEAGGVVELPWPTLGPAPEQPPTPTREPRDRNSAPWREWKLVADAFEDWRMHTALLRARSRGRAYGFTAAFRSMRGEVVIGWGEGRCDRGESNWVDDDDHELESMAQTRGQSRALAAPLRFVVKLAGYEGTPAEDLNHTGAGATDGASSERVAELEAELERLRPLVAWASDESLESAAQAVGKIRDDVDGHRLIVALARAFKEGVPEAVCRALRIFAWALTQPSTGVLAAAQVVPDAPTRATAAGPGFDEIVTPAEADVVEDEAGAPGHQGEAPADSSSDEAAPPDPAESAYHNPPEPASSEGAAS